MSRELVWEITRNTSCFLVRRGQEEFTREPGNLLNRNSFKYSTLAGSKTVAVKNNEKGAVLILSRPKKQNSPVKATSVIPLIKGSKHAKKMIHKVVACGFRGDLEQDTLQRVVKYYKSHKLPKPLTKKPVRGKKLVAQ